MARCTYMRGSELKLAGDDPSSSARQHLGMPKCTKERTPCQAALTEFLWTRGARFPLLTEFDKSDTKVGGSKCHQTSDLSHASMILNIPFEISQEIRYSNLEVQADY